MTATTGRGRRAPWTGLRGGGADPGLRAAPAALLPDPGTLRAWRGSAPGPPVLPGDCRARGGAERGRSACSGCGWLEAGGKSCFPFPRNLRPQIPKRGPTGIRPCFAPPSLPPYHPLLPPTRVLPAPTSCLGLAEYWFGRGSLPLQRQARRPWPLFRGTRAPGLW